MDVSTAAHGAFNLAIDHPQQAELMQLRNLAV